MFPKTGQDPEMDSLQGLRKYTHQLQGKDLRKRFGRQKPGDEDEPAMDPDIPGVEASEASDVEDHDGGPLAASIGGDMEDAEGGAEGGDGSGDISALLAKMDPEVLQQIMEMLKGA